MYKASYLWQTAKTMGWPQNQVSNDWFRWPTLSPIETCIFHINSLDSENTGLCSKKCKALKSIGGCGGESSTEPSKKIQLSCCAFAVFLIILWLFSYPENFSSILTSISHRHCIYTWNWYSLFAYFYAQKSAYAVPKTDI